MQKTYVVSFGLFFRASNTGGGGGTAPAEGRPGAGGAIDRYFPSRETREKDCFPVHYVFLHEYDIHGAIVYFLIFLLFAFRRFKSARL